MIFQGRNAMAEKITYYALVDDYSSREKPGGVVRRVMHGQGQRDEAFSRDLTWKRTSLLYAAERGDTMNDFVPITEEEAMRIVDRIRREVATSD
jgi:hypothetical protein